MRLSAIIAFICLISFGLNNFALAKEEVLPSGATVYKDEEGNYVSAGNGKRIIYTCANEEYRAKSPWAQKDFEQYFSGKKNPCATSSSPYPRACRSMPYEESYNAAQKKWNDEHPNAKIPDNLKIVSLITPLQIENHGFKNAKAKGSMLVNLYIDPATNRIIQYSTEHRSPPSVANPKSIKIFRDPRTPFPTSDGKLVYPGDPSAGGAYDKAIEDLIVGARSHTCDFFHKHNKSVAYAEDPGLKDAERFNSACSGPGYLPEGCGEKDAAKASNLRDGHAIATGSLCDDSEKKKDGSCDFNLMFNRDLLLTLQKGIAQTKTAIIASTLDDPRFGALTFPNGADSASCGRKQNAELAKAYSEANKAIADQSDDAVIKRAEAEWRTTLSLISDAVEAHKYKCHVANSYGFGAPVKDDTTANPYDWTHDNAREKVRLNTVLNRNHVLGLIGEGDRKALYKNVKAKLAAVPAFKGFNLSLFESGKTCRGPEAATELRRFKERLAKVEEGSPEFLALMDPKKGALADVRNAKLKALGVLQTKAREVIDKCPKAKDKYDFDCLSSDEGLNLWMDENVTGAMSRRHVKNEPLLAEYKRVLCDNRANLEKEQFSCQVGLGIATAAVMLVPVAGQAAATAMGSTAIAAYTAAATTGLFYADLAIAGATTYKAVADGNVAVSDAEQIHAAGMGSVEAIDTARDERNTNVALGVVTVAPGVVGASAVGIKRVVTGGGFARTVDKAVDAGDAAIDAGKQIKPAVAQDPPPLPKSDDTAVGAVGRKRKPRSQAQPEQPKDGDRIELREDAGAAEGDQYAYGRKADSDESTNVIRNADENAKQRLKEQRKAEEAKKEAARAKKREEGQRVVDENVKDGKNILVNEGGTRMVFSNTEKPGRLLKLSKDDGVPEEWLDNFKKRDIEGEELLKRARDPDGTPAFDVANTFNVKKIEGTNLYLEEVEAINGITYHDIKHSPMFAQFEKMGGAENVRSFLKKVDAYRAKMRKVNEKHLTREVVDPATGKPVLDPKTKEPVKDGIVLSSKDPISGKVEATDIDMNSKNFMFRFRTETCETCLPFEVDGKTLYIDVTTRPVIIDF